MPALGAFLLLAAFVTASGAFAASIVGARRRRTPLIEGGVGLFHVVTALMLAASAVLVHAFVTGDFTIKYVQRYSNEAQPLFYKLASYWGGLDGSIMFWVTLLGVMGSAAVHVNRIQHRLLVPWVVATIAVVEMFFLFVMVLHNNPFGTYLSPAPADGAGLNPLLQNFYMAIHPPMLYLGLVGMTIPFAFGIAALASGQLDEGWLRAVRRWTMFAWLFLTVGLTLGGLWAYEELGWSGYWGWDPVENAGLLPWFTATAFVHSVMVQERRGMLKIWNISLVILTFFLTIFATFMTRSGVVQSVHAFGENPELARMFTGFMILTIVVSFGLVIARMPLLRARNELDSWASREAAFLVNNWVLLFSAFFILFATMFPTLSEALTGERLTVGPPFYNRWMVPIGLILLLLTGVGPLLAWRKSTLSNMQRQFLWPVVGGVVVTAGVVLLGVPFWASGLCFGLCAFSATTIIQEFIRGAAVRRQATGTDRLTALVGLVARSRRRYGGYLVHVGVVLMFLGFAGGGLEEEISVTVRPGQQITLGDYVLHYRALTVTEDAQKQMVTAELDVERNGSAVGGMYPARWFFFGKEEEPTTEVALRRTLAEDLYVVLGGYDAAAQSADLQVSINPLVNWIWFGVGVVVIGAIVTLLPERAFAFAVSRVPEGAVTTSMVVLMLAWGGGLTRVHAQHIELPQTAAVVPRSALEREMHDHIVCMCGTCGRKRVGECTCGKAAEMRAEIATLVAAGRDRDGIIQHFVTKYGSQEVLAAPINRGFNRLAWLLPYAGGLVGIGFVAGMAVRWTRRRSTQAATPVAPFAANPELEDRLDDELRELD
jgi:cytochrome c-type biogenesis protein CcmF